MLVIGTQYTFSSRFSDRRSCQKRPWFSRSLFLLSDYPQSVKQDYVQIPFLVLTRWYSSISVWSFSPIILLVCMLGFWTSPWESPQPAISWPLAGARYQLRESFFHQLSYNAIHPGCFVVAQLLFWMAYLVSSSIGGSWVISNSPPICPMRCSLLSGGGRFSNCPSFLDFTFPSLPFTLLTSYFLDDLVGLQLAVLSSDSCISNS